MAMYLSEPLSIPPVSVQGANELLEHSHELMLMAGFEQTDHPGQLTTVGDYASGSLGYRIYHWVDAYSEVSPVYVKMELYKGSGSGASLGDYLRFSAGAEIAEGGAAVGYWVSLDDVRPSAGMLSTAGRSCVVSGDGYVVVGIHCGGLTLNGSSAELGTPVFSRGLLILSRLTGEDGQVDPAGVTVIGRGWWPATVNSSSTNSSGSVAGLRNVVGRIGRGLEGFTARGGLIPYIPLPTLPVTADSGLALQHPFSVSRLSALYADTRFGFAPTQALISFGSMLEASVGGEPHTYVALNGLGVGPKVTPKGFDDTYSYDGNYAFTSRSYTSDMVMWVRVSPEDL